MTHITNQASAGKLNFWKNIKSYDGEFYKKMKLEVDQHIKFWEDIIRIESSIRGTK